MAIVYNHVMPKIQGGLPAEYQELSYIESTGTQYIDTGVQTNSDMKVDMEFAITSNTTLSNSNFLFGAYKINESPNVVYFTAVPSTSALRVPNGTTMANISATVSLNTKHHYIYQQGSQIFNDVSIGTKSSSYTTGQLNIYLFCRSKNEDGTTVAEYFSSYKLYSFRLYNGSTLVRNFIPCYRKSDGEVGLYDTVGKSFYTNAGTGTFVAGPSIDAVYLYNEGDECTSVTGGWEATEQSWSNTYTGHVPTIVKNSNMQVKSYCVHGTTDYWSGSYSTKNKINLSGYTKLCMEVTSVDASGRQSAFTSLTNTEYVSTSSLPKLNLTTTGKNEIDISNVNQQAYVGINVNARYGSPTLIGSATITKIWLE